VKINFVYHTPKSIRSGYFGSVGLYNALKSNDLLHYGFDTTADFLDVEKLQECPVFYVRGFLKGRMPYVARAGNQFKAAWQSESYYTRRGEVDTGAELAIDHQEHFQMYFVTAETDLDMYSIPTHWLPSWADITIFKESGKPVKDGLGFFGGRSGREDFLDQDERGIIKYEKTGFYPYDPDLQTRELAELISSFKMLVSPPGRCFNSMCGRAFEIMACNRLCFQYLNEDTMYKHMVFFKDMQDIVYFKSFKELYDKYEFFEQRPDEMARVAGNGYEKVRRYHNQNVRAKYIVECMESERQRWQADQDNIPDVINEVYSGL